jgi:hypothetical protein
LKFIPIKIPISEIILENPFNGKFSNDKKNQFSVEDINPSSIDIQQRLNEKLQTGKCSSVIINQIALHSLGGYEKFGDEIHQYHFPSILNTIEYIEKDIPIKIVAFKHKPLLGLKHAHHNSNTFAIQNMLNHWKSMVGKNNEIEFQNNLLESIHNDISNESQQEKVLQILLQKVLYASKARNSNKHSGEWIVFGVINDVKYYLCLGTHNEDDQDIYERLKKCLDEFPILKNIID